MGVLHDRPLATKEDIWESVYQFEEAGEASSDYVFGRMMKLGIRWTDQYIIVNGDLGVTPAYQAWCDLYPTDVDLIEAAKRSLSEVVT